MALFIKFLQLCSTHVHDSHEITVFIWLRIMKLFKAMWLFRKTLIILFVLFILFLKVCLSDMISGLSDE